MNAIELTGRLQRKELSAAEVKTAFLDRIEAVNPKVNHRFDGRSRNGPD
jgi:amidase